MFYIIKRLVGSMLVYALLSGCSTREVVDMHRGATAERLVTYSMDELIASLPEDDFAGLQGQTVWLKGHFIEKDERLAYVEALIRRELESRYHIQFVSEAEASYELDFFFYSLSTDTDSLGFSVPLVNLNDASQQAELPLLTLTMYHGISEARYYIKERQTGAVLKGKRLQARVRTDHVATPFISFPWSNL